MTKQYGGYHMSKSAKALQSFGARGARVLFPTLPAFEILVALVFLNLVLL